LDEFDLIARYFSPLAGRSGLGLLDDAACITPPTGKDMVVSKDMLVAGIHFFPDDKPASLAFKALSVNISDLAAKGARPHSYLLGLSLPEDMDQIWIEQFADGLAEAQKYYNIELIGGDTTSTLGPITISVTAIGYVEQGGMVRRNGACIDDRIYVTGTLGDAALALLGIRGECKLYEDLLECYHRPVVNSVFGQGLCGRASASADVSDGLIADIHHICKASGVGAVVNASALPVSANAARIIKRDSKLAPLIWSGGDDYKIVFTASAENGCHLKRFAKQTGVKVTEIGKIVAGAGVDLVDFSGQQVQIGTEGFMHFSKGRRQS